LDTGFYNRPVLKSFININEKLIAGNEAAVPHDNRAFRYGDGLFETMLLRNGQIDLEPYHWRRLFAGMEQLHFRVPRTWSPAFFSAEIAKTIVKNKLEQRARIRLQVWQGTGGLFEGSTSIAGFIIECFPVTDTITQLNENGLIAGIAPGLIKSNDSLANLKSTNAQIYASAARLAQEHQWNDALIINHQGHIIESTIANIFWIKDGELFTPPLTEGCVAGTMRQYLLDYLPTLQLPANLKALTADELQKADEIFLTNAIRKIKWVREIGTKNYGCTMISKLSKMFI